MSAACPKYLFKMTDPSFSALFQLRQGGFGIANAMELKSLQSALKTVQERASITHLIPDRHASVKKHMQDQESDQDQGFHIILTFGTRQRVRDFDINMDLFTQLHPSTPYTPKKSNKQVFINNLN